MQQINFLENRELIYLLEDILTGLRVNQHPPVYAEHPKEKLIYDAVNEQLYRLYLFEESKFL